MALDNDTQSALAGIFKAGSQPTLTDVWDAVAGSFNNSSFTVHAALKAESIKIYAEDDTYFRLERSEKKGHCNVYEGKGDRLKSQTPDVPIADAALDLLAFRNKKLSVPTA